MRQQLTKYIDFQLDEKASDMLRKYDPMLFHTTIISTQRNNVIYQIEESSRISLD
jgi:hypothetical protein